MEQHLTFIDQSIWTSDLCVGGTGGHPFLLCAQHPFTVKVVKFYRDEYKIRGIYVENWDGTILKVGVFYDESPVTIYFDKEERLTHIWLYSRKLEDGTFRFAGFRFHTNKRYNIDCFPYNYHPVDTDRMEFPVGTGMFCGIYGRASADIDCCGFCLKKY